MDKEERHRIVQALTYQGFVNITKEQEIIDDGKKSIRYSDDHITIYSPTMEKCDLFLIEYGETYYIAYNSLDYIVKDFYKRMYRKTP